MLKEIKRYIILTLAAIANAAAISFFIDPNHLAPGGVTGIAVIGNYLYNIPTGTVIFLLNIPIMVLGIVKFGVKFFVSTVYVVTMSSIFANLFSEYEAFTNDPLLASLGGGALLAVSIGTTFKQNSTTGGVDIIVRVIKSKYRHISTGKIYLMIDTAVVALSALVFKDISIAMYSVITAAVSSYVVDYVLYGGDDAKLIYVISRSEKEIARRIMQEVEAGVTFIDGEGAYSGNMKQIIMCVVRKPLFPKIQQIVREEDDEAFIIVSSASEVFGEGFKGHSSYNV